MKEKPLTILDFDLAMELARTDPEAFEQYRQDVIEVLIARAPERNRHHLRCLQWRIGQERERAPNPYAACVKLYRMMWESFAGESGLIDALRKPHDASCNMEQTLPKAKVLAFSRKGMSRRNSES
jgi:hypothetical protein